MPKMKLDQKITLSASQIGLIVLGLVVLVGGMTFLIASNQKDRQYAIRPVANGFGGPYGSTANGATDFEHAEDVVVPEKTILEATDQATIDELLYIIEEEKLAHDVYSAMYDRWGARTFQNIQNSEVKHQASALTLLEARGVADPRQSKVGVFRNQDLQKLYDKLITQGNQSLTEAYEVGVLIEETDIADIQKTLDKLDPVQTDIKTVLESLKFGSENHLRAFSRRLQ